MNNYNPTLYEILGRIPEDSTQTEIEQAYKKLAMLYHPDQNPNRREWAEEQMKKLNEAKEILTNPEKRRQYQHELLASRNQSEKKETVYPPQYPQQQSSSGAGIVLVGVGLAIFALGAIVSLFDDED